MKFAITNGLLKLLNHWSTSVLDNTCSKNINDLHENIHIDDRFIGARWTVVGLLAKSPSEIFSTTCFENTQNCCFWQVTFMHKYMFKVNKKDTRVVSADVCIPYSSAFINNFVQTIASGVGSFISDQSESVQW